MWRLTREESRDQNKEDLDLNEELRTMWNSEKEPVRNMRKVNNYACKR